MNNFVNEERVGPASQMICSMSDDANDFQMSVTDTAAALHECDGHDPFHKCKSGARTVMSFLCEKRKHILYYLENRKMSKETFC